MPSPSIEHLCNGASTFLSPTSDRGLLTSLNHSLSFVKLNRRSVSPTSLKPLSCSRRYAEIGKKKLFYRWEKFVVTYLDLCRANNSGREKVNKKKKIILLGVVHYGWIRARWNIHRRLIRTRNEYVHIVLEYSLIKNGNVRAWRKTRTLLRI